MRRRRRRRPRARQDRQGLRRAADRAPPADEATRAELQDYVKAEIAPYKYPRAIEFVATLPRTETGKMQRFRLREEERRKAGATP